MAKSAQRWSHPIEIKSWEFVEINVIQSFMRNVATVLLTEKYSYDIQIIVMIIKL